MQKTHRLLQALPMLISTFFRGSRSGLNGWFGTCCIRRFHHCFGLQFVRRPQLSAAIEHPRAYPTAGTLDIASTCTRRRSSGPTSRYVECDASRIALPLDGHSGIPVQIVRQGPVVTEEAHRDPEESYDGLTRALRDSRKDAGEVGEGNGEVFVAVLTISFGRRV